ncbi:RNA 3'-terminal phosphate cyclase [Natronomonas halophila]|uniref:RNA 3'-terminal phosphate cyclase n=1 Tax=Natronomonas halophila TaxID=2747817 RepID=UPI0015B69757|nr:RNA 3'-terminal phosphate cyclase [Natronomonas halophila]QLD86115.1 RNA 3'-terminal phosphate cyclase [Natronomonas halophila]
MHEIDGAAGGGQIVRTAVTLSALSGEAVRIENIRGDRPNGGLRPQHLAAVEAAAALCDADVEGDERESETLEFDPGDVAADDVTVEVGTAGSVTLVADTVLPLATALDEAATVTITGGTDVQWSPPLDFLRYVKLPLLLGVGFDVDVSVESRGFYPVGGGEIEVTLRPSAPEALAFDERGALRRVEVYSVATEELEDPAVAGRQAAAAAEALPDVATPTDVSYVEADSTGSALVLAAVYEGGRAGFTALGEAGKPSEEVASEAVDEFQDFHDGAGAVDRRLADQLMVPLALAGGEVLAPERTDHVETNRGVIETFGYEIAVEERDEAVLLSG